jgi:nicotinamide riboside kinase
MSTFVQIRGGNASGKTTIIRNLIEKYGPTVDTLRPARSKTERVLYSHLPAINTYILGSYRVIFGGLDSIESKEETQRLVAELLPKGNVICEGIRASGSIAPWQEFLKPQMDAGHSCHMVLLNTSVELMIESAIARTGRTEPFTEQQIKDRRNYFRTINKQNTTWREWDSRMNVIYDDRDACNSYVDNLAKEFYYVTSRNS